MSDPDHLKGFDIISLYIHWLGRQNKGLSPFIVLSTSHNHEMIGKKPQKSVKASVKEKEKMEYIEVDEEMEEEEEEEGKHDALDNDGEEEMPLAVRFGPPIGKAKKKCSSTLSRLQDL